jgi:hypothetical protein
MKFLAMLLVLLAASAASVRDEPDFPSLSDQILWKTEREVCQSTLTSV